MAGPVEHREWSDLAFENPDERLTIDFEITFEVTAAGRRRPYQIRPTVYLNSAKGDVYTARLLAFNERTQVYYRFRNGDILEGWLEWQDRLVTAEANQVTSRISLQSALTREVWNYEGFMVQFGAREPVPPTPPVPPVPPFPPGPQPVPQPAADVEIGQVDLTTEELFPFIYLQPWPTLTDAERQAAFVTIPDGVTKSNKFWTALVKEHKDGDAPAMRDEAKAFIDGTDAARSGVAYSDADFIRSTAELIPPFDHYLEIWVTLEEQPRMDFLKLTALVEDIYGGWTEFEALLAGAKAQAQLQVIWNSVIALLILLGYRHALLADLIRVLVVNHVLVEASQYADKLPPKPAPPPDAAEAVVTGATATEEKEQPAETPKTGSADQAAGAVPGEDTPPLDPLLPSPVEIRVWRDATLIAPAELFPLPGPDDPVLSRPGEWVRPYAIGTVQSVHYQPVGYELGEVQRIENILRGEVRERTNRNLTRTETRSESRDRRDETSGRDADTVSADLINQVRKTLSDRKTTTNIDAYDATYGMPDNNNVTVTGNWWVQDQPAGGYLQDVSKFARDVIEKTVRRISREVHDQRMSRRFEEHETSDVTRFENLQGAEDIRGIYRWVNRSYRLIARDLGDRLVLEMMLEKPAAQLLRNLEKYWDLTLTPPATPEALGAGSYHDISPVPVPPPEAGDEAAGVYYLDLFEAFGVTDPLPPPEETVTVSQGLKRRNPVSETSLEVPDGYTPTLAWAQVTSYAADAEISVFVGTTKLTLGAENAGGQAYVSGDLPGGTAISAEDGSRRLWVSVLCKPKPSAPKAEGDGPPVEEPAKDDAGEFTTYYLANVEIECSRTDQRLSEWQYQAYRLIQQGYATQLAAFRAQLDVQRAAIERENPDFLRDAVNSQIIQGCVVLLYERYLAQTKLADQPADPPEQIEIAEPRIFQYLRNALAWSDLNCQIYLDYKDRRSRWMQDAQGPLLKDLSPDLQFRNFLRAERARILVTVRPELTRSFLYFLGTGQIWPNADRLAPCLDSDVDAIAKLKAEEALSPRRQTRLESWVIQVPTSMTVLSAEPFPHATWRQE